MNDDEVRTDDARSATDDVATVRRVFGEPYARGGVLVIPVASVTTASADALARARGRLTGGRSWPGGARPWHAGGHPWSPGRAPGGAWGGRWGRGGTDDAGAGGAAGTGGDVGQAAGAQVAHTSGPGGPGRVVGAPGAHAPGGVSGAVLGEPAPPTPVEAVAVPGDPEPHPGWREHGPEVGHVGGPAAGVRHHAGAPGPGSGTGEHPADDAGRGHAGPTGTEHPHHPGRAPRGGGRAHADAGAQAEHVRPLGVYVLSGDDARWKPAVDVNRVVLGGQVVGALIGVTLAWALPLAWAVRRRR